jgi:hypothetical protein
MNRRKGETKASLRRSERDLKRERREGLGLHIYERARKSIAKKVVIFRTK